MWQVTCELEDGQTGKLVTDSWPRAVWQFVVWRIKRRSVTMARYESKAWPRRGADLVDRRSDAELDEDP